MARANKWITQFLANVKLALTFAICYRRSVCLSVLCLSVTLMHPTQPVKIFGSFSPPSGTLAIR